MITCEECVRRLYPDDPRVPTGRYHHSTCDYFCNKPTYYRELEKPQPQPQVIEHIHRTSSMDKQEFDLLQQTSSQVKYLLNKIDELQKRRTPKKQPTNYKGLKVE